MAPHPHKATPMDHSPASPHMEPLPWSLPLSPFPFAILGTQVVRALADAVKERRATGSGGGGKKRGRS